MGTFLRHSVDDICTQTFFHSDHYYTEHSYVYSAGMLDWSVFAVAGLEVDDSGNDTGHITVQLFLSSAFNKIKTPMYWESAAYGR